MNMPEVRLLLFVCLINLTAVGQTSARLGITGSPNFSWATSDAQLSNGFFKVTRVGFNSGINMTLSVGPRFFTRLAVNFSQQSFALRQNSDAAFKTDVRYKILNLEIPLTIGVSGFLGTLRHREFVGAGLQLPLSNNPKIIVSGDSSSAYIYSTADNTVKPYPVLIAGFEIGSQFNNDGGLYFGANFRYGLSEVYRSTFNSNRFNPQPIGYNGTYLGLELTFYFPRFSYWFKRDFTF
jgi:hypothetical protein